MSPTHSQKPAAESGGLRIFFRRYRRRRCGRAAAPTSGGTGSDTAAQERLISGERRRRAPGPRRSIPHGSRRGKVPSPGGGRASFRPRQQSASRRWTGGAAAGAADGAPHLLEAPRSGRRERRGSRVAEHQAGTAAPLRLTDRGVKFPQHPELPGRTLQNKRQSTTGNTQSFTDVHLR